MAPTEYRKKTLPIYLQQSIQSFSWIEIKNTQNHWDYGLCPSSVILTNKETQRFGNWIFFPFSSEGEETPTLLGPLETANLNRPVIEVSPF
jgi:hypothetical protein